MTISPYVQHLREHVGTARILLPAVSALVRDMEGRLLLVRQRDGGVWSTPGGSVEPGESPADAVVRETWEEAGLWVEPVRLVGVFGGPELVLRYPNGDETQYVNVVFECAVRAGQPRPDGDEIVETRFCTPAEAGALALTPWLRPMIAAFFTPADAAAFDAPSWRPPPEGVDAVAACARLVLPESEGE